jgi:hypothetical protein
MNRPEISRQNKARQRWKIRTIEEQNYRVVMHSATNCLLQLYIQVF